MLTRFWSVFSAAVAMVALSATVGAQPMRLVNINSNPAGATVRLGSATAAPIGTTPLHRARVPAGPESLYFDLQGYVTGRIDITVRRTGESFTATLSQAGSVYVTADVDGATILLDGNALSQHTPARLDGINPGPHMVEIRQDGLRSSSNEVTVTAGQVVTVNGTLRPPTPQAPPTGTVRAIVQTLTGAPLPPDFRATLDGAAMSGTPPSFDHVDPGTHVVQVTATGFRPVQREVQVTAGQVTNLAIDLEALGPAAPAVTAPTTGSVRVIVQTPGATATLDGSPMQGSPPVQDNVPPGPHVVQVTAPGRVTYSSTINVTAGQMTPVVPPDLAPSQSFGRIDVTSPVPGAQVFVNPQMEGVTAYNGPAPYSNPSTPSGGYAITVRAPGFTDFNQTCQVSPPTPCTVTAALVPSAVPLVIHLAQQVYNPHVVVDDQDLGLVSDSLRVPPGHHRVEVRADGYTSFVLPGVDFVPGNPVTLNHTLARTQVSTWGAMPLAAGDLAFDTDFAYSAIPLEVRATVGILPTHTVAGLGVDAGFAVRSMFTWWEFELRGRVGYQLTPFLSVGTELRGYAAIGTDKGSGGSGLTGLVNLSLGRNSTNGTAVGSFTFTLHLGFEYNNDTVGAGVFPDRTFSNGPTYYLCQNAAPGGMMPSGGLCDIGATTRGFLGGAVELGLTSNIQGFFVFDYYLAAPDYASSGAQRAITTSFWNVASQAVPRIGLTWRF